MADDLPDYRAYLLRQPCCCAPCVAAVQVHHAQHGESYAPGAAPAKALGGKRGKSQRASDWWGLPLCFRHHRQLHDGKGPFADLSPAERRAWQDKHITRLRAAYAMTSPQLVPGDVRAEPTALPTEATHPERERVLEQIADWAGAKRLKAEEHQLIHDLINDLRAQARGDF